MHDLNIIMCVLCLTVWQCIATACPSCVGALTDQSASFFTDECYQYSTQQPHQQVPENHKETNHES